MARGIRWALAMAAALAFALPAQAQITRQTVHDAVGNGDIATLSAMLNSGQVSAATIIDDESNTPLHLAAERCNTAMIQLLLSRGGNPVAVNKWGDTPRRIAAVRCGAGAPATLALNSSGGTAQQVAVASGGISNAITDGPASRTQCLAGAWEPGSQDKAYRYRTGYGYGSNEWLNWQLFVVTNNCSDGVWVLSASCVDATMAPQEYAGAITDLSGGSGDSGQFLRPGDKLIASATGMDPWADHRLTYRAHEIVYGGYSDAYARSAAGSAHISTVKHALWHRLNAVDGSAPDYALGSHTVNRPEQVAALSGVPCGQAQLYATWSGLR